MSDTPVREHDKFMLRLPDGMRDRLKEEAAKHKRSLNAEIVARLEATLVGDDVFPEGTNALDEYRKEITQIAARAASDAALKFIKAALSGEDIDQALNSMKDEHLVALGESVTADQAKEEKLPRKLTLRRADGKPKP